MGRLAARLLGIPVTFTAHGWSMNPDRFTSVRARAFRIAERIAGRISTKIINVCEHERALALKFGVASAEVLCTVHNGMPDIDSSLSADPSVSPPLIVMVARMEEQKDHETLIHALARLKSLEWNLALIGDGPQASSVHRLTDELGLTSRVRWLGDCKWSVAEQLSKSQIFALISKWEAFPRSILEAMRAGLPVITTDVSGVKESVVDGATGFLIPNGDRQTLEIRLRHLIGDPELRTRMGRAGRSRYETHFTFERMFGKTVKIYQDILSAPATRVLAQSLEPNGISIP